MPLQPGKAYTLEEILNLPADEVEELLKVGSMSGTAVVRRADGTVKYDDPSLKGTYGELDDGSQ